MTCWKLVTWDICKHEIKTIPQVIHLDKHIKAAFLLKTFKPNRHWCKNITIWKGKIKIHWISFMFLFVMTCMETAQDKYTLPYNNEDKAGTERIPGWDNKDKTWDKYRCSASHNFNLAASVVSTPPAPDIPQTAFWSQNGAQQSRVQYLCCRLQAEGWR